jgi:hypothetical protein
MAAVPVWVPRHRKQLLCFSIVFDFIHIHSSCAEGSVVMSRAVERRASVRHETVNNLQE